MSASPATGVAWRTDGFWTLLWLWISLRWTSGRLRSWPPRGFVGAASRSFRATGPQRFKLSSIRLHHVHFTRRAPHWQLISVWRISRRSLPK